MSGSGTDTASPTTDKGNNAFVDLEQAMEESHQAQERLRESDARMAEQRLEIADMAHKAAIESMRNEIALALILVASTKVALGIGTDDEIIVDALRAHIQDTTQPLTKESLGDTIKRARAKLESEDPEARRERLTMRAHMLTSSASKESPEPPTPNDLTPTEPSFWANPIAWARTRWRKQDDKEDAA